MLVLCSKLVSYSSYGIFLREDLINSNCQFLKLVGQPLSWNQEHYDTMIVS